MKIYNNLYVWLVAMIQTFKGDLPAETEEKQHAPLKLDLQFFADDNDDDDSDDGADDDSGEGDDADDEGPSLDELLKDKAFKKQYNDRLKEQLGKRMKKFEGVDPEEYKRLKASTDKSKGKDQDDDKQDDPNPEQQKRLLRAERREKKAVVKEFAVDNGHNPKLLARLLDVDAIELDEDGEPENLDELFEELEADFPEYFGASDDDDEENEPVKKKKFVPGSKQKSNKAKDPDPAALAKADIERRHGKQKEE